MSIVMTTLDWCVVGIMLLGSMAAGLYLSWRAHVNKTSAGFFLAGRRLLWPVVGLSLYATNIGAEHLVGLSGDSYRYGLKAGTVELGTVICLGIACWLLFPTYIRTGIYTIPEFLERRYDVRARLFFSGFMLVICIMTKMAFTLFAGALVLHSLTGWDVMTVVAVLAFSAAIVTMIGGFAAVAYTDAIQAVIMIVGCAFMLVIGLDKVGGWQQLRALAGAKMHVAGPIDDPNYPFWGIIVGVAYAGTFYWGMDQVNVQRVLGAKDLNHGCWGAMFAVLLKFTPIFIFALPGVIAYALYPRLSDAESKQTFVWLLNHLLPSGIRGLVLAALLAALISSILAVMNSISTMVVRDFVKYFLPDISEKRQVQAGRAVILGSALLGTLAAYLVLRTQEGLYRYLQALSFYLCVPLVPPILGAILSKRVNMKGAVAGVLAGSLISLVYVFDGLFPANGQRLFPFLHTALTKNYTFRGLWEVLVVTMVLLAVSYTTPPPDVQKVTNTVITWPRKPEPWQGLKDWRLQCSILAIVTVLLYVWLW